MTDLMERSHTCPWCQRGITSILKQPGSFVHLCGAQFDIDTEGNITLVKSGYQEEHRG